MAKRAPQNETDITSDDLVGAFDGVGIELLLPRLRLRHLVTEKQAKMTTFRYKLRSWYSQFPRDVQACNLLHLPLLVYRRWSSLHLASSD